MTFIEAQDLALRFGCLLPRYHKDDPRAAAWIAAVVDLPLARQQGRLAEAITTANRCAL
jgi:hypothetical protein